MNNKEFLIVFGSGIITAWFILTVIYIFVFVLPIL